MIADPWKNILRQVVPKYDFYKNILEKGPRIKASIIPKKLGYIVRIEEDWYNTPLEDQQSYYTADYAELDEKCNWAAEQLQDWKFVKRHSFQEWKFSRKIDAEKFVILFNLKWV